MTFRMRYWIPSSRSIISSFEFKQTMQRTLQCVYNNYWYTMRIIVFGQVSRTVRTTNTTIMICTYSRVRSLKFSVTTSSTALIVDILTVVCSLFYFHKFCIANFVFHFRFNLAELVFDWELRDISLVAKHTSTYREQKQERLCGLRRWNHPICNVIWKGL